MTTADIFILVALIAGLGGLAGFLAGLLGIGGGIVLVPGLHHVFSALGYAPEHLMHLAVGTSLAVIVPTGFASARAHWKRGAVRMELVRAIGPGILIGVAAGTALASALSSRTLEMVFAVALIILAGVLKIKTREIDRPFPAQPWPALTGTGIGTLSSLMGIGGATMNVPFMTLNGVSIHKAVGSAAAMGLLIAVPGAIGYVLIGLGTADLPPFSLGFVNLAAAALVIPASVIAAPFGAKVAHRSPVFALKAVFSAFMVIVAAKMLYGALHG